MTGYRLPDGTVPVLVSAVTADLVRTEASALLAYATAHPDLDPPALAGMLFRTRIARPHRALAMVTGRAELLDALAAVVAGDEHPAVVRTRTPAVARRIAFVCPGQGGQRPGMGRVYYDAAPPFRAEADRCAEEFRVASGAAPLGYLLDQHPAAETAGTVQPALFTQMAALAAMWHSFGVEPTATVGHSQGEIAAAYLSGVITLTDAVRVIGIRAAAADELSGGGVDYAMAMVAADRDTCESLLARCAGFAELSVVNSPGMTGISGDRRTVQAILDTLTGRGVFARIIGVHYPAHTSAINSLRERFGPGRAGGTAFRTTDIPCVGATLGAPITPDLPAGQYWFLNLRNTVRFDKAISTALALGIDTFVELAEHPTLQLAIADNAPGALVVGTSDRAAGDLTAFTRNLALLAVNALDYRWDRLRTATTGATPLPLVDFPNTAMNEVPLWLPYDPGARSPEAAPEPAAGSAPARLLTERWVRLSHRALVPSRAIGIVDHTGDCAELAIALCGAAADIGATARVIDTGSIPADLDSCVLLLPPSAGLDDGAAAAAVSAFFADRRRWPASAVSDCWLVTVAGEAVVADDTAPDLVHAGVSAGFRSVGAEHPGVRFRHLDLPAGSTPATAAAAIVSALHTADETELALRDGGLYAKRITAGTNPPGDTQPPRHVLILGGTGHLGLEFCEHFTRSGARRITLVSRSGETEAVAARLRRIRSVGAAQIEVRSGDIGDRDAVARLAAQCADTPADLIIHATLVYSEAELADITAEQANRVLRSKVVGIWRILQVFPRTDDCRVVLCSSVAATIGGRGQIIYAAANRMLDAMAHRLRSEGLDCVAVQWGQWTVHFDLDPAGWAKLAATGLLPMRPADAIAVGLAPLGGNAIVAGFDLAVARAVLSAFGYGPLLSELTSPDVPTPGAPPIAESDLEQRLIRLLAGAIGVDRADAIDTAAPMVAIGLDSLQALEFRRRVKNELNHDLDVAELLGGASIADLLARLGGPG